MPAGVLSRAARVEDARLISGRGAYVSSLALPGMLHAVFVRSSHAHARVLRLGLDAARASSGVVAVLGAADFAGAVMPAINPLGQGWAGSPCALFAVEVVEAMGQPVAMVVARSLFEAEAAAELVEVEYVPLPALADHAADAVVTQLDYQAGDLAAAAQAAAHTVSVSQRQPRVSAMAMEPRATVAAWSATPGDAAYSMTVWLQAQAPARSRDDIARVLGLLPAAVRVITPDVGGAFGARASVHPEDLLVALAAQRIGAATGSATVKWCGTRSEEFTSAVQGRGAHLHGTLTLDAGGRFTSLHAQLQFPLGAWLPFSAAVQRAMPRAFCRGRIGCR